MGVAHVDLRARRSANCCGWSGPSSTAAHVHRGRRRPRVIARAVLDGPDSGRGRHRERRRRHQSGVHRRLGQAADPVSAHLGRAPVGVPELHGQVGAAPAGQRPGSPRRPRRRTADRTGHGPASGSKRVAVRRRPPGPGSRSPPRGAWSGAGRSSSMDGRVIVLAGQSPTGAWNRPREPIVAPGRRRVHPHDTGITPEPRPAAAGRRPGSAGWPRRPPRSSGPRPRGGRAVRGSRGPGGRSARAHRARRPGVGPRRERPTSISRRTARRSGGPGRRGRGRIPTRATGVGGIRARVRGRTRRTARPDPW